MCSSDPSLLSPVIVVLHNCLMDGHTGLHLERCTELVTHRSLITALLHHCAPAQGSSTTDNVRETYVEWMTLIVDKLLMAHLFPQLYEAITVSSCRITPEQIVLFQMVAVCCTPSSSSRTKRAVQFMSSSSALSVATKQTFVDILVLLQPMLPTESDREQMWHRLALEGKFLLYEVIGGLCSDERDVLKVEDEEMWQKVLELSLVDMRQHFPELELPRGFKSELIRCVGNLCFRHHGRQEYIRSAGGLEIMLNHCHIEDKHPFLREWSVLALRNCCEGNETNQQYVQQFHPQAVSEQTQVDLQNVGVEAQLNQGSSSLQFSSNSTVNN